MDFIKIGSKKEKGLKLYYMSQRVNNGFGKYIGCVVCAFDENDAKSIHPSGSEFFESYTTNNGWATSKNDITCEFLGYADKSVERGVILNAKDYPDVI